LPAALWLVVLTTLVCPEPDDQGDERQGRQWQEHGTNACNDDPNAQEHEHDGQQKCRQIPEVFHKTSVLFLTPEQADDGRQNDAKPQEGESTSHRGKID